MVRSIIVFVIILTFTTKMSFGQNKAIVLQNVWSNELNNYNPREFIGRLYQVLREQLSVKQVIEDPKSLQVSNKGNDWDKNTREQLKERSSKTDTAYFITMATELRLPKVNLGKLLFKNPPRSSKLTFTYHIYNGAGNEVIGDTIINRGCLSTTVDEEKGNSYFYSSYESFMNDMKCHVEVIRKEIQEKLSFRNKDKNG